MDILTVVAGTIVIIGGLAAVVTFFDSYYAKWLQFTKKDTTSKIESVEKKVDEIDNKLEKLQQSIQPVPNSPVPLNDFLDGLPQLTDSHKKQIFETGMKLRDDHQFKKAINKFRLLLGMNPSDDQRAALLTLIGNSFFLTGNQDEALGSYKEALKAAEQAGNQGAKGNALGNIGLIYRNKGEPDEALKYHNQALEIAREIGYKLGEADNLGNIGVIYQNRGEPDEALKYHNQALEIDREIGYKLGEASDLGNIGVIYQMNGEPDEALKYYNQALEIFELIGAQHLVNKTNENINIIKSLIKDN